MKTTVLFLVATLLTSPLFALDCKTKANISYLADAVSTRQSIQNGASERNPIYGKDPSDKELAAGVLLRAGITELIDIGPYPWANCIMAGFTMGIALQNTQYDQPASQRLGAFGIGFTLMTW